VFLLTFAIALGFNAFPFPRYALPITVLIYFISGQLMVGVLHQIKRPIWVSRAMFAACMSVIGIAQGTQCCRLNLQFADDSRQRLREWVATHLSEQKVLTEDYTALDGAGDPWRYPHQSRIKAQIVRVRSIADGAETIDDLKAAGIEYVAVAEPKYERYFRAGVHAVSHDQEEQLLQHRQFYRELFERAELVWSSVPSPPSHAYVNPELYLYRLPDPITLARPKRAGKKPSGG
jgi:hypothetical protein